MDVWRIDRWLRRSLAAVFVAAIFIALPASAGAYIYWSNAHDAPNAIGRANLDGTDVDHEFVPSAGEGCDIAVDPSYVYWSHTDNGTAFVARASLNTKVAENQFIQTSSDLACGVAVDSSHLYFNDYTLNSLGRANINGSSVEHTFITGGVNPQHPYVHGGKIYWTNKGYDGCPPGCTVGVADLSGIGVNQNFITGTHDPPSGVAVNDSYLYWSNGDSIGRSNLAGTVVDPGFITTDDFVCDVAVDQSHIYWARWGDENLENGSIGRASIDGSGIDNRFIDTAGGTCGVAVDSGMPSNGFSFTVVPRITCAGVCRVILVKIKFNSDGLVVAEQVLPGQDGVGSVSGKKQSRKKSKRLVKKFKKKVTAGKNKLKLKLTKAGKKKLKKKGKLKFRVRFTFTPTGGVAKSKTQTIKVKIRK